jgi:hypothetical protein
MAERMPRHVRTSATVPSSRKRSMDVSMKLRSKTPLIFCCVLLRFDFWGERAAKNVSIHGAA